MKCLSCPSPQSQTALSCGEGTRPGETRPRGPYMSLCTPGRWIWTWSLRKGRCCPVLVGEERVCADGRRGWSLHPWDYSLIGDSSPPSYASPQGGDLLPIKEEGYAEGDLP